MYKNIVFCADGTWNNPDEDENADYTADPTNVYKLFECLDGAFSGESIRKADEQEKELTDENGTVQIAKYIHGVGDSRNAINHIMGGAFGAGVISRVVRGYTFISRNYEPDANIFIVGFSRGAYTARALAGLIASQGVLSLTLAEDKERAYRCGAEAWYRYRKNTIFNQPSLARLAEIAADLPAFLTSGFLRSSDLVAVDRIVAVGVWDTVGSMGIPIYAREDKRMDAFRFADGVLNAKIQNGFHAVALDERRTDFAPTLWNEDSRVVQTVFPGAHCDVGGGYPESNNESGLSDGALKWMIDKLEGVGVRFANPAPRAVSPNPLGVAHQPWSHLPFSVLPKGPRRFLARPKVTVDPSVDARMAAPSVISEPNGQPGPYRPENVPPH